MSMWPTEKELEIAEQEEMYEATLREKEEILAHADAIRREQDFPSYYKDGNFHVFTNNCNELFVKNVKSGVVMRVSATDDGNIELTSQNRIEPFYINGLIGYRITTQ